MSAAADRAGAGDPPVLSGGLINPDFVNLNQATNIVRLAAFAGDHRGGANAGDHQRRRRIDLSIGAVVTLAAMLTFRFTEGRNEAIVLGFLLSIGSVWWSAS